MRDIDWRWLGFEGRVLSHLLSQIGMFYGAHRTDADVTALLHLLDHHPAGGRATVLAEAIATAATPAWIIEAVGAPLHAKDALKSKGYRWNADRRHWWREVRQTDFDEEFEWCVLSPAIRRRAVCGGASAAIRRLLGAPIPLSHGGHVA